MWKKLIEGFQSEIGKFKSEKMTAARQKVQKLTHMGRGGVVGIEARLVSLHWLKYFLLQTSISFQEFVMFLLSFLCDCLRNSHDYLIVSLRKRTKGVLL